MLKYKKYKNIYKKSKKKVLLFKADWCGHCKKFENTWFELKKSKELKDIIFEAYDEKKDEKKFNSYRIESFPTILLQKKDVIKKYEGDRNIQDLTSFILYS